MNKTFFIIILPMLIFGCKSNPAIDNSFEDVKLTGNWQWIRSSGGLAGSTIYPARGTKVLISITSDNLYTEIKNDTILFSHSFILHKNKTIYSTDSLDVLDFQSGSPFNFVVLKLTRDTLSIGDNCYDGYNTLYTRVRQ